MALIQFACWNVFLPIWRIEMLYIVMWYWWIHGRLEAFVSTGVYFIKCMLAPMCDSTLQLFLYYCHSFFPTVLYQQLLPFVSGARDLQSPPLSAFSSFPTSLSRQRGPRRFCCKQSARAGPTVFLMVHHHPSAKTCSMKCTKLQVKDTIAPHATTSHRRQLYPIEATSAFQNRVVWEEQAARIDLLIWTLLGYMLMSSS